MPAWGLDEKQRETQPWGLPAAVLAPGKVVTDPVHGDIHLNRLEVAIADSGAFQRLRRVRQLGTTHLVYPGATHSRFSHSLGAVHVAQQLLDQILSQRDALHAVPDLFGQWLEDGADATEYNRRVAEVVILARLGGLLHDLCHVPVGHSVEDDLQVLEPHDENTARFGVLWADVRQSVREALSHQGATAAFVDATDETLFANDGVLFQQLAPLVISKRDEGGVKVPTIAQKDMEYPFVADLVGNTICADLLDYLVRDHLFAGLPASLGHRFISAFFVVPDRRGPLSRRMALNIERQEHERSDVVSEVLKALRYRYELTERALYHHAKLSADAMLGEALERWTSAWWLERAAAEVAHIEGHEKMLADGDVYTLRAAVHTANAPLATAIDDTLRADLEQVFLRHGDDGLLETMSSLDASPPDGTDTILRTAHRMRAHAAGLSRALLDRSLFRIAGRVGYKDTSADALFGAYGRPADRDRLERGAERFAGLNGAEGDGAPQVVLWLPAPKMRLKLAKVLVQHNAGIGPFVEYEESRSRRGVDIYAAHMRLWSCFVYVRRDVTDDEAEVVTTFLAGQMGVRWERHQRFGEQPTEWSSRLAVHRASGGRLGLRDDDATDGVLARLTPVAARGFESFDDLLTTAARATADQEAAKAPPKTPAPAPD